MHLMMVGISHRQAPIELRERLALAGEDAAAFYETFRRDFPLAELFILSTCNRVELYAARPVHASPTREQLLARWAGVRGVSVEELSATSVVREGDAAVSHLMRVAVGLESMVLGETQILGQVRRAYEQAAGCGALGSVMHPIVQRALRVGKQARSETGIGKGRASVASVAITFARAIFDRFDDKVVLNVGAGEVGKAMLKSLRDLNPHQLWVVSRDPARAIERAEALNLRPDQGGARPMEELDAMLVSADVVAIATGSTRPLLTAERLKPLIKRRRRRPLLILDLGLPRDVEPAVAGLTNVYLYDLDTLAEAAQLNAQARAGEVQACERLVHEAAEAAIAQVRHADLGRLVRQLREHLLTLAASEQMELRRALLAEGADPESLDAKLERHTHRLINKVLHVPLAQVHDRGETPLAFYAAALRRLFNLRDEPTLDESPPVTPPVTPPVQPPIQPSVPTPVPPPAPAVTLTRQAGARVTRAQRA